MTHSTHRKRRTHSWQRVRVVAVGSLALLALMATVMGVIRLVQWQRSVQATQTRQLSLQHEYHFNPGKIISDGQMFNVNAMSVSQVQQVLNEQGQQCSGNQCLKTIRFDTPNVAADAECAAYRGGSQRSAASIIDDSAHACGISQEVLLTMLQKEQHLLSATAPTSFQYEAAMGLSCPDTQRCDPQYAGFFRQVFGAAKRLQYYRHHLRDYGYQIQAMHFVRYSPNASCSGTNVFIDNEATALLYIYTPYQPNLAALQAGDGTGDACSSYGNRNFALIYRSLFNT